MADIAARIAGKWRIIETAIWSGPLEPDRRAELD
jgi:hypothetical protein